MTTPIYIYCQPTTKEITTVTRKQLDADARGGRVVIEVDSSDAIIRDPDRLVHYQLDAAGTGFEATGKLTIEECLADANWRTLSDEEKSDTLRDCLRAQMGI